MTGETCTAFCAGFTYAGVEYAEEVCTSSYFPLILTLFKNTVSLHLHSVIVEMVCIMPVAIYKKGQTNPYLLVALQSGSVASTVASCAMTCTGNRWEICGGPNLLTCLSTLSIMIYSRFDILMRIQCSKLSKLRVRGRRLSFFFLFSF
jgi:hypothetical protein